MVFLLQPKMLASARLTRSPQAFPSPGVPRRRSPDLRPSRPAGGVCDTRDTRDRSTKARRSYTRIPNAGSSLERTGPPGQSACGSCGFAFRRAFGFPVVGLRFGGAALGGGGVVGFWRDLVAWGGFEERAGAGQRDARMLRTVITPSPERRRLLGTRMRRHSLRSVPNS